LICGHQGPACIWQSRMHATSGQAASGRLQPLARGQCRDRRPVPQLFRRWDEHWRRYGFGYWTVRRHGADQPVGFCGIKVMRFSDRDVANLFYRFDPTAWGCGLATEAASAVTSWAAENIPDRVLIARVRPQNVASQRVAVHAGLERAEHLDTPGEDGLDWI